MYHVDRAIKLADAQVGRNGKVLTLPLYMGGISYGSVKRLLCTGIGMQKPFVIT